MSTGETPLANWGSGATAPRAHRSEDVVLHAAGPWSRTVMSLLRHLETVGFDGAPRPVGDGFATDGREAVTYIPGTTPHPGAWDDDAIAALGTLVRRLHDATASFQAPADARWQPSFARLLPGSHPVIGHGDLGPSPLRPRPPLTHPGIPFCGPSPGGSAAPRGCCSTGRCCSACWHKPPAPTPPWYSVVRFATLTI